MEVSKTVTVTVVNKAAAGCQFSSWLLNLPVFTRSPLSMSLFDCNVHVAQRDWPSTDTNGSWLSHTLHHGNTVWLHSKNVQWLTCFTASTEHSQPSTAPLFAHFCTSVSYHSTIYIIHSSICIVLCCVGVEMSQTDVYTLGRVYLQLCTALHLTIPLLGVIPVHLYWLCLPVYKSLFTIACSGDVCLCFFAYVSWFWLLLRSMPASEFVVISRIALHQNFFSYQATKYSLVVLCLASKSGSRHLLLAPWQQKNSFGLLGRWQLQNSFGVDPCILVA